MNGYMLGVAKSCCTTAGYYVTQIELRGGDEIRISGIIKYPDTDLSDDYVSWALNGTKPSIKRFGNLILWINTIY